MVDEQTFVREVKDMEPTLYRVSRGFLPSWEECADAVQEALTKAWHKRHTVQPQAFRPWLMRIVINECHNIGRKKKRLVLMAEVEPDRGICDPIPNRELHEALMALPEKLRIPVLLHYMEGFSLEEVSRMVRIPMGTVKSQLHRARAMLRDTLTEVPE